MRDLFRMDWKMAMEFGRMSMDSFLKEIFWMEKNMDMESIILRASLFIEDNSKMVLKWPNLWKKHPLASKELEINVKSWNKLMKKKKKIHDLLLF